MMFKRSSGVSPPVEQRSAAFALEEREALFTRPGFPGAGPGRVGRLEAPARRWGSRSPARAAELGAGLRRSPLAQPQDGRWGNHRACRALLAQIEKQLLLLEWGRCDVKKLPKMIVIALGRNETVKKPLQALE